MASGTLGDLRMNPTQTLHAVDNLAMSAFAITYANQAECLGLGGAAGQAWWDWKAVLENSTLRRPARRSPRRKKARKKFCSWPATRMQLTNRPPGIGVALLFSKEAQRYAPLGCTVRLLELSDEFSHLSPTFARMPQPGCVNS